jgi:hypothetical protein
MMRADTETFLERRRFFLIGELAELRSNGAPATGQRWRGAAPLKRGKERHFPWFRGIALIDIARGRRSTAPSET